MHQELTTIINSSMENYALPVHPVCLDNIIVFALLVIHVT